MYNPGFNLITFTFGENSNCRRERYKGKTLLGVVHTLFIFKNLLTTPSNVLPLRFKQTFPPII